MQNELKGYYINIDKTLKNINKELVTLKEDLKNIEKLGKNYTNKDLFYQELSKINLSIGDLETINLWSFKDKKLRWKDEG